MGKIVAAIPTNRPELCKEAVEAWRETGQFDEIWVMWDGPAKKPIHDIALEANLIFYHQAGDEIIPRRSACCRSRLVLEAWKRLDVEWLVHLDDDVRPWANGTPWKVDLCIADGGTKFYSKWYNTIGDGFYPRGHPYSVRGYKTPVKIVHGVWNGVPDLDAATQLQYQYGGMDHRFVGKMSIVPPHQYFAMSSMNVAIHRDLFPASYFLWMGWDLPLNKYGDIWCGVILKKICDHFGWACATGGPVVQHIRASNVWKNLKAEAATIEYNEDWWKWVDAVPLKVSTTDTLEYASGVIAAYRYIVQKMYMKEDEPAFVELREKMLQWISLFES